MYEDDDVSDLTEISDEEYGAPKSNKKSFSSSSKAKSSANATGGFRIKNALKVPRPTTYTVQALYDQIHSCDINLEPDYQRDVVWPEGKQIGIIDSIFRNFYIPPVIFAVNLFDDGAETRTCIDGKQRLTSIYRFMDGLIPHKDPFTGEKVYYKDVGQSKGARARKLLPEKYRRLFANKQIVCVEYYDITDQDEREIFQRVQLGMALTPAEKLQVVNSPRAQFIRELQTNYLKEEGGGLNTSALDWDRARGADFRCLAQSIYIIDKYTAAFKTAPTILQLEKWLSDEAQPSVAFKKQITDTFDILVQLVREKSTKSVFKNPTKVSPVEFVLIVVLLAVSKDKMSLAELSEAIGGMRDDVRSYHADIRMNTKVTKTMLDYVRNLKPGKVPHELTAGYLTAKMISSSSSTGDKRKRDSAMDVDTDNGSSDDEVKQAQQEQKAQQQPPKKVKKSPPTTSATPSTSTATSTPEVTVKPPKFGPPRSTTSTARPPPTLASASVAKPSSGAGERVNQFSAHPPPSLPPRPPPSDRLAGVRAARAAATAVGPSPGQMFGTGAANDMNGQQSPRIPSALPSPSISSAGFRGGLGISISQPALTTQSSNAIPLPIPSSQSQPYPSNQHPRAESMLQSYMSSGHNQVPGGNYNGIPFSGGRDGEGDKREREKREREQWELERYGRVQKGDMQDQSAAATSTTSGSVSSRGVWGGGSGFVSDNGWGRRGQAK